MKSRRDKILEIIELQDRLNSNTNGENWRNGVTNRGKVVNWKRCIYMESCELIDSFPWKHWKSIDAKVDRDNIEIELVDILHFIVSYLLMNNSFDRVASLIDEHIDTTSIITLPLEWSSDDSLKLNEYLEPFENLLAMALVKSDDDVYCEELVKSFFEACSCAKLDFETMYKTYIGKNSLNIFRQDNGYKEGSYKKEWSGREDNVVLQEIIKELEINSNLSFESIYSKLELNYKEVN
jgi:hypothetical protein